MYGTNSVSQKSVLLRGSDGACAQPCMVWGRSLKESPRREPRSLWGPVLHRHSSHIQRPSLFPDSLDPWLALPLSLPNRTWQDCVHVPEPRPPEALQLLLTPRKPCDHCARRNKGVWMEGPTRCPAAPATPARRGREPSERLRGPGNA